MSDDDPATERTPRGRITPWLFLVGLLAVFASALLFVLALVRGTDIVRAVALNAAGAALLVAVAAYDTRQDPDSVVTETTGAVGTALLLYGLYLFASGLVVTTTSVVHGRLVVGIWSIGLAIVSVVGGVLSFPTRTLLESQQQSAREQYETAVEACEAAVEHVDAGEYDRARTRYGEIESTIDEAVRAEDAIPDDAERTDAEPDDAELDESGRGTEPVAAILTGLDEQGQAAVEAGTAHLDADEFGAATAAFTAAQQAHATARYVAAATDHERTEPDDEITAWVEVTDGLATAAGAADAGAVASALQALDEAGEAVTDRQHPLFDRKRVAILADAETTRRETAAERLADAESILDGEAFTAVECAQAAIRGARAALESSEHDVAEEPAEQDGAGGTAEHDVAAADAAETAAILRGRIRAWTTVTDRVTVGEAKLEEGDHTGVLELLEAALVAANALDGGTDPDPRQMTAWLRGCERIMDAYGEATAAVEAADEHRADGDESSARDELERALAAFDTARAAATRAGIDTDYIDREAQTVTERLESVDHPE
jgi:tetratricopeptide (TPR) repeat protein